jgi:hypothetical protein
MNAEHKGLPVLKSPANRQRAVGLTYPGFHYAFTNTMDEADAKAAFERYALRGPGRVVFESALLLIWGGMDHIVPASVDKVASKRFHVPAMTPA